MIHIGFGGRLWPSPVKNNSYYFFHSFQNVKLVFFDFGDFFYSDNDPRISPGKTIQMGDTRWPKPVEKKYFLR